MDICFSNKSLKVFLSSLLCSTAFSSVAMAKNIKLDAGFLTTTVIQDKTTNINENIDTTTSFKTAMNRQSTDSKLSAPVVTDLPIFLPYEQIHILAARAAIRTTCIDAKDSEKDKFMPIDSLAINGSPKYFRLKPTDKNCNFMKINLCNNDISGYCASKLTKVLLWIPYTKSDQTKEYYKYSKVVEAFNSGKGANILYSSLDNKKFNGDTFSCKKGLHLVIGGYDIVNRFVGCIPDRVKPAAANSVAHILNGSTAN